MAKWKDVEHEEPDFAARVRALFDARKHKTLATLRADGSPRISGIEVEFNDGELTFGSMPDARKGTDLVRDPRFALHGPTVDPPKGHPSGWPGEAKVAGRAVLVGDLEGETPGQLFRAELDEVVLTRLTDAGDRLLIEVWRPGVPLRRIERD
jgi:Pyridoxamine 5'-phosphate oxidase